MDMDFSFRSTLTRASVRHADTPWFFGVAAEMTRTMRSSLRSVPSFGLAGDWVDRIFTSPRNGDFSAVSGESNRRLTPRSGDLDSRGGVGEGRSTMSPPGKLTRVTQIALVLNALAHGTATLGMATGLLPHSADEPFMARRAAAAGLVGVIMMVLVSRRLTRDATLIVLPIAFTFFNLAATAMDFVATGDPETLPPAVFEATFFAIYCAYALTELRASKRAVG
jgi:hypothetical protein